MSRMLSATRRPDSALAGERGARELEREARAGPAWAVEAQLAAHPLGQLAADRQPEAEAALPWVSRPR